MKKQILLLVLAFHTVVGYSQEFSPRYELIRLGPNVNTKLYDEVSPVTSVDGKKLYFFIFNHPENTFGTNNSQDIWFSTVDDKGEWSKAKRMGPPLNQRRYNQVFNMLPDGSLFVRGGRSKNTEGFSILSPSGGLTELGIRDFEKMSKGTFYGGSLSADAKHAILYFSETTGSKLNDLYVTNLQADGSWSRPVKLSISSPGDEYGPFIAPDQKTLYFSSERNSPVRYGGADIYKTTRLDDTWSNWSAPVNLGKPINTSATDSYFSIDANGNVFTCRMGSVRDGGNYDILILKPRDIKIMLQVSVISEKTQQPVVTSVDLKIKDVKPQTLKTDAAGKFETRIPEAEAYTLSTVASGFLPKEQTVRFPKVDVDTTFKVVLSLSPIIKKLYLSGTVYDKKTQQPVRAKVDVLYQSNTPSHNTLEAEGGKFNQEAPGAGKYILTASAEGYLNGVDSLNLVVDDVSSGIKDLYLAPIEVGTTVRIKNIYFDFDKTTLKPESFVELNKVVDFLKLNASLEIEIEGHTDSKGADEYNLNLSQGRSQSVVDYIVSQGIDGNRLKAKGFGETKPVDTNDTEEGRANNRRVEFTVLKK